MAVSGKTARRLLKFLLTTDPPEIHAALEGLANQLDNDVEGGQGTLAARSAPSLRGRIWVVEGDATAINNGRVWWDTGLTWTLLNPRPAEGKVYEAIVGRVSGTEYEPSASVPVQVIVFAQGLSSLKIGGVEVPTTNLAEGSTVTFICQPGVKWKATGAGMKSSYLPLA